MSQSKYRHVIKTFQEQSRFLKAKRTSCPRKVSDRGESRLLQLVKREREKILKDVTNDFHVENVLNKVSRSTVQRILHKNPIYMRFIRKHMVVKEINKKRLAWSL